MKKQSIKYNEVDWAEWPQPPNQSLYDDWITARASKNHPALTQTSLNKYGRHVTRLVNDNVCSADMAIEYAAEAGWRAIMYNYVVSAIHREMDNSTYHQPCRDVRSITLQQQLTNTSWADGVIINDGE